MSSKPTFGSVAYTGLATVGRVRAVIGAIVVFIITIILIFAGAATLKSPHTGSAAMTVTKVHTCTTSVQSDGKNQTTTVNCVVDLVYTLDGQQVAPTNVRYSSSVPVQVGQTLNLRYDPAHPLDVKEMPNPKLVGWGLILGGIIISAISITMAVFTIKSKQFAAIQGSVGIAQSLMHRV